jgi:prepilin-type N-terminal cleavage/methylation domain-containing protein
MNTQLTPTTEVVGRQEEKGFTLVEILIAIVLVGILAAVAVVGISNLVSKGTKASCTATADSAKAASQVYFAANSNTYPADFTQLTTGSAPAMSLPSGVSVDSDDHTKLVNGSSWTLTLVPVSGAAPNFTGCPA